MEITRTTVEVTQVVEVPGITLELTMVEAGAIRKIMSSVGGVGVCRDVSDKLWNALQLAGVDTDATSFTNDSLVFRQE
jgi:hypothetical protein